MSLMTRSRAARCLGALIGAAALVGALPAPAQAERRHERRHHDDRGRGHRYDDDDHRHRHGRGCDHGRHQVTYAPRYYAPPRWVRAGYWDHRPAYTCGRCRTHFGSYDGLYGLVHTYHRVPAWQVPGVLAQVSFGWTFGF